jgi:hypothetical protein
LAPCRRPPLHSELGWAGQGRAGTSRVTHTHTHTLQCLAGCCFSPGVGLGWAGLRNMVGWRDGGLGWWARMAGSDGGGG